MVASSSFDLKWLHKIETVDYRAIVGDANVGVSSYQIADFFDTKSDATLRDVEDFLDSHSPHNLNLKDFLVQDILLPIEHAMRCGVRDIGGPDAEIIELRRNKAIFIIGQVIPRIYVHPNFAPLQDLIAHGLTRLLKILVELAESISPNEDDIKKQTNFFRDKDFLSNIALQVWGVCLYEQGIPVINDKAIPLIRKLAMLDSLDSSWNYVGGFENVLKSLEERLGSIPRISADKQLHENTDVFRLARSAVRRQIIELTGQDENDPRSHGNNRNFTPTSTSALFEFDLPDEHPSSLDQALAMHSYNPKCSAYYCSKLETSQDPHRLRCYKCHFYHWCSPACQEYSEQVAKHHTIFCQVCPQDKADRCRAQMEDYLNLQPHEEREDMISCHGCGISKSLCKQPMMRCETCLAVSYCGKTCQEWDWEYGGHSLKCEPPL